jgi:hypothetical protein
MATTDEAIEHLCEVMAAKYGAGVDFRESLHGMVAKCREAHERRMRDAQAAELLPLGREVAAERLGVAPSTVYKMVHRFRRARSTVCPAA